MAAATIVAGLACASPALGQTPDSQPATRAPKQPAPPLFPRHHRGLYRNPAGIEVIDATPQSPPLDTDDPGVPDKGAAEINVTTRLDYSKAVQSIQLVSLDSNYGVRPVIAGYALPSQIKIEIPLVATHQSGVPHETDVGPVALGMKVNFYRDDHRGIAVSVYPQSVFAGPGTTLVLPVLVAREFHVCTIAFNIGLEKPLHDPDHRAAFDAGIGVGRALTRKVAAMIEIRGETSADVDDRVLYVNGGVIHGVRKIVYYFNLGHSLFSGDGYGHAYAGVGLKLLIEPKHKG
jgi:hypothetical protein